LLYAEYYKHSNKEIDESPNDSVDILEIDISSNLTSICENEAKDSFFTKLDEMMKRFKIENGFPFPPIRIKDDPSLPYNSFSILLYGTEVVHCKVKQYIETPTPNGNILKICFPSDFIISELEKIIKIYAKKIF